MCPVWFSSTAGPLSDDGNLLHALSARFDESEFVSLLNENKIGEVVFGGDIFIWLGRVVYALSMTGVSSHNSIKSKRTRFLFA